MRFHQWYIGIVITLFSTIVSAANCTPLGAIGKISDIVRGEGKGSAFVIRAACPANERIPAYVYQMLYEGDRIEATGKIEVIVVLAQKEKRIFSESTNHQPLHGKTVEDIEKSNNNWFGMIASISESIELISKPREPVQVISAVRSVSGLSSLKNNLLFPSGLQYLPIGYDQTALLCQNGNDPQNRGTDWHVQVSARSPLPLGMSEPDPTATSARLIRAIWILKEGSVEWRLFALSELAKMSKAGFFAAEELWDAACSGELAAALKTR